MRRILVLLAIAISIFWAVGPSIHKSYMDKVMGSARQSHALSSVKRMVEACRQFKEKHGHWPVNLRELMTDPMLHIEESDLLDPWRRPFLYEAPKEEDKEGEPRVWSSGMNPNDPQEIIGSWMPKPPAGATKH